MFLYEAMQKYRNSCPLSMSRRYLFHTHCIFISTMMVSAALSVAKYLELPCKIRFKLLRTFSCPRLISCFVMFSGKRRGAYSHGPSYRYGVQSCHSFYPPLPDLVRGRETQVSRWIKKTLAHPTLRYFRGYLKCNDFCERVRVFSSTAVTWT